MKKIIFPISMLLLVSCLSILTPDQIEAKKRIIRKGTTQTTATNADNRLLIKPKLRADRRALIVNFSNLGAVSSFNYELNYDTQGILQGVAGTVIPSNQTTTQRELLFGTCSRNVCRYHTGLKNMKFTVTSTLKSGVKVRKGFKIKP